MNKHAVHRFQWVGPDTMHLDQPMVTTSGKAVIGRYGGRIDAGADKNEDGALVWSEPGGSWEFAMLLDAHTSADSAHLVLNAIDAESDTIFEIFSHPAHSAFPALRDQVVSLFQSDDFRRHAESIQGETACLICARKEQFLWWFNVGDCLLHLLHPELAEFGQFSLNQRNFYEWIGKVNTFDLPIPCYSSGVRELRTGRNIIMLCTDGLLDGHSRRKKDESALYSRWSPDVLTTRNNLEQQVMADLTLVHKNRGTDSATIITWIHENSEPSAYPTIVR